MVAAQAPLEPGRSVAGEAAGDAAEVEGQVARGVGEHGSGGLDEGAAPDGVGREGDGIGAGDCRGDRRRRLGPRRPGPGGIAEPREAGGGEDETVRVEAREDPRLEDRREGGGEVERLSGGRRRGIEAAVERPEKDVQVDPVVVSERIAGRGGEGRASGGQRGRRRPGVVRLEERRRRPRGLGVSGLRRRRGRRDEEKQQTDGSAHQRSRGNEAGGPANGPPARNPCLDPGRGPSYPWPKPDTSGYVALDHLLSRARLPPAP